MHTQPDNGTLLVDQWMGAHVPEHTVIAVTNSVQREIFLRYTMVDDQSGAVLNHDVRYLVVFYKQVNEGYAFVDLPTVQRQTKGLVPVFTTYDRGNGKMVIYAVPYGDVGKTIVIDGRMIYQDQCHGIARVTIELIRNLPSERACNIVLLLARDRATHFDISDLEKYVDIEYSSSVIGRPYDLRDLWRTLRRLDASVFYSPYHALAPLKVPCALVVGLHDCIVESDRRLAGSWLNARLYRANTLRVLRRAAAVVVPSVATKELIPAFYSSVPPTTVCLNGVDVGSWRASAQDIAAARRELNLPPRYILHVGARRLHKNQRVLVEALPALDPDVSLVLLGHRDPRMVDEVGELASKLGVADRVISVEGVADSLLRGVYAGAEVFAFPSVVEGYGLPPLEAMAAGLPVVASATPAVAEVCHGAALLVSPFSPEHWVEALGSVLSSPTLRTELVGKGRAVAESASWADGAAQLYRMLSEFTEPSPALVGTR